MAPPLEGLELGEAAGVNQIDERIPSILVEHGQIADLTDPYLAGLSDDLDFRAGGAPWA